METSRNPPAANVVRRTMPSNDPLASRYRSLQASRRALGRAAPWVRYGLFATGVGAFLEQVKPLVSDGQFTWGERRVMGVVALVTIGGFGLAGWAAGRLLRAAAELIEVFIDGAEAAVRTNHAIEATLAPTLARAAAALERLADASSHPPTLPRTKPPDADALLARIDAARRADDPETVIACRDALTQHLRGDALVDLDRRVVRWLSSWINRKVRDDAVDAHVAALAERVADGFGDAPEAAALLAALPDLRRRAGLCPACARPYRGRAGACPDCLEHSKGKP